MANENSKSGEGRDQVGATSAATANASNIVAAKRKYKKRNSGGAPEPNGGEPTNNPELAQRQQELQQQFDRLYAPEVWEGIVAAPANVALAITGNEIWDIPEKEVKILSVQASVTARCFAVSDPKWLALSMLAVGLATTYGARIAEYYSQKAKEKAAKGNPAPKNDAT
jgi:hypothetical protein